MVGLVEVCSGSWFFRMTYVLADTVGSREALCGVLVTSSALTESNASSRFADQVYFSEIT